MLKHIKKIYKTILTEKTRIKLHYIKFYIRGYFYSGSKVTCVCCNKSFTKFLPHGNVKRQNAVCPSCNTLERNRVLFLYLRDKTNFFHDQLTVLHFAPEYRLEKIFRKMKNLNYTSGDINPDLAMQQVDIQSIGFPDNHFDVIICSHVLGHVPDEAKALSELRRVLKPEGSAIIMTKIYEDIQSTFEASGMYNAEDQEIFRKHGKDFPESLKEGGFDVSIIDVAKDVGNVAVVKYGLGEKELIYLCKRKAESKKFKV
ncbi:MAG: class I SAM-dependent methyltransferase [Sporocytophaga sp.]|nr:class I SAM-dependent methyltransferase [Sporocytophaga sp.]